VLLQAFLKLFENIHSAVRLPSKGRLQEGSSVMEEDV